MRSILGAVLAGGTSRRLGHDKALATVAGEPLAGRAIGSLREVFDEVVVVTPERRAYDRLGAEVVPDLRADQGPLGGLHAALVRAAGRPVFVLACDLPFVSPEMVRFVGSRAPSWEGRVPGPGERGPEGDRPLPRDEQARIVELDGRLQPLCGFYSGSCLASVESRLARRELSVVSLVGDLLTRRVRVTPDLSFWRDEILLNVNRPEDLARVRSILEQTCAREVVR